MRLIFKYILLDKCTSLFLKFKQLKKLQASLFKQAIVELKLRHLWPWDKLQLLGDVEHHARSRSSNGLPLHQIIGHWSIGIRGGSELNPHGHQATDGNELRSRFVQLEGGRNHVEIQKKSSTNDNSQISDKIRSLELHLFIYYYDQHKSK